VTIEYAVVQAKQKPWGSNKLLPWSHTPANGDPIGELWFARTDAAAPESALLLKLLFTTAPLSIQVHPDDAMARSIGLSNGKTEAWYILSAAPDARVAIGLKRPLSPTDLRSAISDGSIADLVQWHPVSKGDAIFIPAGIIHSIGAGIVLAEIQQRSNATFRLFDYGRRRELHIDNAVAAARAAPAERQSPPEKLNAARLALVICRYFVLEQVDLLPGSVWTLGSPGEIWILVIEGHARFGSTDVSVGQAVFIEADHAEIQAGANGMKALLAYPGSNVNSGVLRERYRTVPEHPLLETREA
jgi:mannose-6-phosphate isomerase